MNLPNASWLLGLSNTSISLSTVNSPNCFAHLPACLEIRAKTSIFEATCGSEDALVRSFLPMHAGCDSTTRSANFAWNVATRREYVGPRQSLNLTRTLRPTR